MKKIQINSYYTLLEIHLLFLQNDQNGKSIIKLNDQLSKFFETSWKIIILFLIFLKYCIVKNV